MITYRWANAEQTTVAASDGRNIPAVLDNGDYRALLAAGSPIADYSPPPPPLRDISDRQFFQQLAVSEIITAEEALAAVKTGDIPAALLSFVSDLPQEQRFAAEMLISGATVFQRSHPMTEVLRAGMGWTSEQVDALWAAAAAL